MNFINFQGQILKSPGPIFILKSPKKPKPEGYNPSPTQAKKSRPDPPLLKKLVFFYVI
jgi:hypothetical protein